MDKKSAREEKYFELETEKEFKHRKKNRLHERKINRRRLKKYINKNVRPEDKRFLKKLKREHKYMQYDIAILKIMNHE